MSDTEQAGDAQTPKHLWVVGIVTVLWNAGGAYDYVMSQTQNESYMSAFTPEQLEFFFGFPTWVVAAWAIAVWGGVLGSILLLMRKSLALPVFIASLVAMVLTTFQNYVLSNGLEVSGTGGLAFSAVIFMVAVALVFHGEQRSLLAPYDDLEPARPRGRSGASRAEAPGSGVERLYFDTHPPRVEGQAACNVS